MIDQEKELLASELKGSLLYFTRFFFQHITGREFVVSNPVGRESHHITICRELTKIFYLEVPSQRLNINIQPGSHKSTLLSMFVAWCWAHYPDCNFLYISYAHELAAKQTAFIKQIVQSRMYGHLFDVYLKKDSRAKDHFETTAGGAVKAFGSAGGITGQNAGLPSLDRFSGAVLLDDCLKPKDAHSDTIRTGVIENYRETIVPRPRGMNVPILSIAQRVHEDDLCAFFTSGKDIKEWDNIILKALDSAGNVLHPEVTNEEYLLALQEKSPYLFSSQYQQDPIPSGGALFKPDGFVMLDEEPAILCTFITADTAETNKSYNDATVFSFWGVYEIETMGRKTGELGLHWLDCQELRIEPKDLKESFLDFWQECMRHPVTPQIAAIEKKSTGVTLTSVLSDIRALSVRGIERSRASGSKTDRFIQLQPIVASKLISFTNGARHAKMCIDHMSKITANDTHRHDDICHVAGSRIATTRGYVNIEDIREGDKVITPLGIGLITACRSTGFHRVIKRLGLESTPEHKVFYEDKFIPLRTAIDMIMLDKLSFIGLLRWKQRKLLFLMERNLDLRRREGISKLVKENIETNFFIALHGNFIQKKKYRKGILFTIKTIINLITVSIIWSVFQLNNIVKSISKENPRPKKENSFWKRCALTPKSIISRKKEKQNKDSLQKSPLLQLKRLIVLFVQKSLSVLGITHTFAQQNANENGPINGVGKDMPIDPYLQGYAPIAKMNIHQKAFHQQNTTVRHAQENAPEDTDIKEVFAITVDTYGVYYVNDILAQNCDTLYDACKIALIDKTIYSIDKQDTSRADKFNRLSQSYKRKLAAGAARNG